MHSSCTSDSTENVVFVLSGIYSGACCKPLMGKVSVSPNQGRLYLLSVLPSKDGTRDPYKQRIPLYLDDTAVNRKLADKRRAVCQKEVDNGTFDWDDWLQEGTSKIKWRDGINALYKKRCVIGRTGATTWETNYMGRLRQLPMTDPITPEAVIKAMAKYKREQCSYKELYYLLKDMCTLVRVPFPEDRLAIPTYNSKNTVRPVPTEAEVIAWVEQAAEDAGWYFGMMATFGLRPHEIDGASFVEDDVVLVPEIAPTGQRTKTGERQVLTPKPEWVDQFDLKNKRQFIYTSEKADRCCKRLSTEKKRLGLAYVPYALRHFYAGMLWQMGGADLDIYTAARYMGHTVKEHEQTYRAHITPHTLIRRGREVFSKNKTGVE